MNVHANQEGLKLNRAHQVLCMLMRIYCVKT